MVWVVSELVFLEDLFDLWLPAGIPLLLSFDPSLAVQIKEWVGEGGDGSE